MLGEEFKSKLQQTTLIMCSYHDVAFSFDADFLVQTFKEGKDLLKKMVAKHLKDKKDRVAHIFDFFGNAELITKLYSDPEYKGPCMCAKHCQTPRPPGARPCVARVRTTRARRILAVSEEGVGPASCVAIACVRRQGRRPGYTLHWPHRCQCATFADDLACLPACLHLARAQSC